MSFFWSKPSYILPLTIKLNQKFASRSGPNANSTVLSAGQDVVRVRINRGYGATMRVSHLPDHGFVLHHVKAAQEAVSPPGHDGSIVFANAATHASDSFGCVQGLHGFIVRKVPEFKRSTFIDGYELVALLSEGNVVDGGRVAVGVKQEAKVIY